MPDRADRVRAIVRPMLAIAYALVGFVHLRSPGGFLPIVPDWVPFPYWTIIITGLCEIAGAVALLMAPLRWWAGLMLGLYAVCVYPANIKHAIDGVAVGGVALGAWYHVPRLAFQPVIVWWALFAGGVIDWPLAKRQERA